MNRPEETLHVAAVAYLRAALPKPWFPVHVPNGGFRTKVEAGKFQKMGVLAGMPDLFVMGPRAQLKNEWRLLGRITLLDNETVEDAEQIASRFQFEPPAGPYIIAIEFKAPPKRLRSGGLSKASPRLSPAQRARQADLGACGVPYLVIDDLAEMVKALKALGVPLKARVL